MRCTSREGEAGLVDEIREMRAGGLVHDLDGKHETDRRTDERERARCQFGRSGGLRDEETSIETT